MDERRSEDETPRDDSAADERPVSGDGNPVGGDQTTEDQLEADNPVEADTLETLDPDNPPA
ncbi:hypothetical protein Q9R08_14555 [Microbacterium sp. QXD-8]|uniref:Nucleotide exchange factor GrpE n=1 Tax=Microbacterium psychrotolerans TaxID=3068321 RepID=A0ABU0Z3P1_9MICO|nr:hypothetical protein [Microbacterium sp. QXD-8]MDQ7879207.1 hypothetical protein [Microbacterium sp. QXD-8]